MENMPRNFSRSCPIFVFFVFGFPPLACYLASSKRRKEELERRKEERGRRKEERGTRKEEGRRSKEEGGRRRDGGRRDWREIVQ